MAQSRTLFKLISYNQVNNNLEKLKFSICMSSVSHSISETREEILRENILVVLEAVLSVNTSAALSISWDRMGGEKKDGREP